MSSLRTAVQPTLFELDEYPERVEAFPQLRYMGSKYRLLPWLHEVLAQLDFSSALDVFSGSGCVSYLLKSMGKRVVANDFLLFPSQIGLAVIENPRYRLQQRHCEMLLCENPSRDDFIERTYSGVFFTDSDLRFLDNIWANIPSLPTRYHRALAITALIRSCVKRQPRGVFTVAGDPDRYKDGRRDLRLSLQEHFLESVAVYNRVVFDNGESNRSTQHDALEIDVAGHDLVYMDPPYVPRADDNCYIKRYHFLEGLASYWQEPGTEIMHETKVKKIPKRFTPFSYRRSALEAFNALFTRFRKSHLVLSYSSNGYPDLKTLIEIMRRHKRRVKVHERDHRYHFGTHRNVKQSRADVREYLIVGE
ncbi:MAG: DNA adenine methylase [Pirellulales bacterium]|nr:DNA adenine methylase [Pirellulales bacterium]